MTIPDLPIDTNLCDRFGLHFVYLDDRLSLNGPGRGISDFLGVQIPDGILVFDIFPELVGRESDIETVLDGKREFIISGILGSTGRAYYNLHLLPLATNPRRALVVVHDVTQELDARRLLQQAENEVSLLSETLRRKDENLKTLNETTLRYINRLHAMEESLIKSREELQRSNDRMTKELLMAEKVQRELVEFIPPKASWLRTAYTYRPLEEVGGDFMSLTGMGDGSFAVFIGDVTGHGVTAALFIALLKSSLRQVFRNHGGSPDVLLERLNDTLIGNLNQNYVTCIYGILTRLDRDTVIFRFASGGHPSPAVMRSDGSIQFHRGEGTMLGFRSPIGTRAIAVPLRPGDRLFLYTDGLPESRNDAGGVIGFDEGLKELFAFSRAPTLEETHMRILEYCDRFRGDVPLQDDITLLSFEITRPD